MFSNLSKFFKRNTINERRKWILEGRFIPDSPDSEYTIKAIRRRWPLVKTIGIFFRLINLFLTWGFFCMIFSFRNYLTLNASETFMASFQFTEVQNLYVFSIVSGVLLALLFLLDFVGGSWFGGLVDLALIAGWIAYLPVYGAYPADGTFQYDLFGVKTLYTIPGVWKYMVATLVTGESFSFDHLCFYYLLMQIIYSHIYCRCARSHIWLCLVRKGKA